MYCPNCYIRLNADRCPNCGNKHLREPYDDDFCYFTEKETIWADTFQDVLEQNGIPSFTRTLHGAGIISRIGIGFERTRFYVPYSKIADAQALADEFFSEENIEE